MTEQLVGINTERVRCSREALNLTVEDVSAKTGLASKHITDIESGAARPTYDDMEALNEVYGKNMIYYFFQSEPSKYDQLIKGKEYSFLREDEHLGENIILLTLGGSRAYGMDTDESDVDIRGIATNTKKEILTMSDFEQVEDRDTDTIIYSTNKAINLMASCNPSLVEMLGVKPEHYLKISPAGQLILDNKDIFLSKRVRDAFCGYAYQQLNRLKSALARDMTPEEQVEHAFKICKRAISALNKKYGDSQAPVFFVYLSGGEIFCNVNIENLNITQTSVALREFETIIYNFKTVKKDLLGHRNKKKDNYHINKHAGHLTRLLYSGKYALEHGEIVTASGDQFKEIAQTRDGKYMLPDGSYDPAFFTFIDSLFDEVKEAARTSKLPDVVDMEKVRKLKMQVHDIEIAKR